MLSGNKARRYLPPKYFQSHLPLQESQLVEFDHLLATGKYGEARAMATTWFTQGAKKEFLSRCWQDYVLEYLEFVKDYEEGRIDAARDIMRRVLEKRFSTLPGKAITTIASWSEEEFGEILLRGLDAKSLEELGLDDDTGV